MDRAFQARLKLPNWQHLPAVVLFDRKGSPPRAVVDLIDSRVPVRVIHDRTLWERTDLLIYTTGGLTVRRERFAVRLNATIVTSAAFEWARDFISASLDQGRDVHIFCPYGGAEDER